MHLPKTLSDGLSISMLGLVLAVLPFQHIYAFASQWRPVTARQASMAVAVVADKRFRPVRTNPEKRLAANQAPVFARQYAWRPAPSSWMPKRPTTVAQGQYRTWQPQGGVLVAQNRWRPVEMPSFNPARAIAAAAPARTTSHKAWRPPHVLRPVQPPIVAQAIEPAASNQPYLAQPTYHPVMLHNVPAQAGWPYAQMPWVTGYMPVPGQAMAYMPQPQAYAYPQIPFNNAHIPAPPMPYYNHSSAMLRPRWMNGQVVWSNRRREDLHQPNVPVKRGTLAILPPQPLCAGCDS